MCLVDVADSELLLRMDCGDSVCRAFIRRSSVSEAQPSSPCTNPSGMCFIDVCCKQKDKM